jgi:hypothetical protein
MTLDASGYLLVGATSSEGAGTNRLQVGSSGSAAQILAKSATNHVGLYASSGTDSYLSYAVGAALLVGNGPANGSTFTERARIDSSGTFRVKGAGTAGSTDAFQVSGSAVASAMILEAGGNLNLGTSAGSGRYLGINTNGSSTGAYLYNDTSQTILSAAAAVPLLFRTSNSEQARITSAGLVGIGTTTPAAKLSVVDTNGGFFFDGTDATYNRIKSHTTSTSVGKPLLITSVDAGDIGIYLNASSNVGISTNSPNFDLHISTGSASSITQPTAGSYGLYVQQNSSGSVGGIYIQDGASNTGNSLFIADNNAVARVVVNGEGDLLVATTSTSPHSSGTYGIALRQTLGVLIGVNDSHAIIAARWNGNGEVIRLQRDNTDVGSIDVTTTATSYNTSSDYRLKNTIVPMTGALAKVALLKPCTYKWNADGSDGEGFIAHELAEVCPSAVTGEKDAVDENGKIKPQGIDVSFLVATLTAAIQELKAEFDAYKASHP